MLRLNDKATNIIAAVLCFVTALSLQIQVTLFTSPTYLGLRINLTDLIVPFAGAAILATLLIRKSFWPQWRMKHLYVWIAVLTAVLALALIHTYFNYGEISRWALVNKFGGWFVLIAIMGIGAWVATNATQKNLESFVRVFLGFGLLVFAYQLIITTLQIFPGNQTWIGYYKFIDFPIAGLMANRNAYALLCTAAIALATCFYFSNNKTVPEYFTYGFYFFLPLFLLVNGSRAAGIALLFLLPTLILVHFSKVKKWSRLLAVLLMGIIFVVAAFHERPSELVVLNASQYSFLQGEKSKLSTYDGDDIRKSVLNSALEMIQARPLLGSGLGSMLLHQENKTNAAINVIDCTALWILVEMGAVGLLIFALFYIQISKSLFLSWKEDEEFSKTLRLSLMFILFAFTLISVFHEILYTRFVWFFLGLGLALPARMRQDV